jgi:hypothetical protein
MRPRFDLSWPFALLGAIPAVPAAAAAKPLSGWAVAGLAIVGLWAIGRRVTRTGYHGWFGYVLVLSIFIGALFQPLRCDIVEMVGIGLALTMMLALHLAAFAAAARQTGRARPGSLAARAETWFVWAAGLLSLDLWVWIFAGLSWHDGPHWLGAALISASVAVKGAYLIAMAWLLHRMRGLAKAAEALTEQPGSFTLAHGATIDDLGVGDGACGEMSSEQLSYREQPPLARVVVGDAEASYAAANHLLRSYLRLLLCLYGIPLTLALALRVLAM